MTNHFSQKQLIKYVDRSLADTKREEMDLHLNTCRECRVHLAAVEALQRQIHYSIMAKRQQVRPSRQMTFAAIAPGLNRSRRIAMFVKQSYSVLSVATAAIIIIALGVGGFFLATNVVQPETTTGEESPSLEESHPSLDSTLDREALGQLLIEAVRADDVPEVKRLLEAGADANFETVDEQHVCILAAQKGNVEVVKLLVEHGCDIRAQDMFGHTPLSYAVINDHVAVVEMLLDRGADVNSKSGGFEAPLLCQAAGSNQVEMTKLLIARGADLNLIGNTDYTPLHCAAYGNSREAAQVLIEAGASLDLLNDEGETPLETAINNGKDDVAQILREAGAK